MIRDIELERAVLASMIISENCAIDSGLVGVDDFTTDEHKAILIGISNLVKKSEGIDYLTLYAELNNEIQLSYLAELEGSLPTTRNFKQYVKDLKDVTLKRKVFQLTNDLRDDSKNGSELAELAEAEIYKLREDTSTTEFTNISEVILDTYNHIEKVVSGQEERGLKTGYPKLDDIVGGLRDGEYILLGARPSIGKTALGINIAEQMLVQNKSVAFFSFEMSTTQLTERLLKSMAMVETGYKRNVPANEWKKLQDASNFLSSKKLFIDDNPNKTVSDMQSMCRKLKRKDGLDIVIIDYLQKVRSTARGGSREQLEQVSNDIKNMAKILDVPVLVISSLSRASEQRDVKIPIMSDLRETGQLEFDADVIMFLHREYYYDRTNESVKREADLVVAKNRNGKLGRTKLHWIEEYTKFLNIDERMAY